MPPTRRHRYRWWSGKWTWSIADGPTPGHDPLRPPWRMALGLCLLGQLGFIPFVLFLFIGGDPYPISRVGVTDRSGQLQIVNAVCPGERLRTIELHQRPAVESAEWPLLWSISGDAPVPTTLAVGTDLAGLHTDVPLRQAVPAGDLAVRVTTTELTDPYPLEFGVVDVPASGILSFDGVFATDSEFHAAVLRQTPCSNGAEPPWSLLGRILLAQLAAAVIGLIVLLTPRCRPPTDSPWSEAVQGHPHPTS